MFINGVNNTLGIKMKTLEIIFFLHIWWPTILRGAREYTHSIPTCKLGAWIFFSSYFKGPSSQDQQKTFRRRLMTFKVTLTGQSHFMVIFVFRKVALRSHINSTQLIFLAFLTHFIYRPAIRIIWTKLLQSLVQALAKIKSKTDHRSLTLQRPTFACFTVGGGGGLEGILNRWLEIRQASQLRTIKEKKRLGFKMLQVH